MLKEEGRSRFGSLPFDYAQGRQSRSPFGYAQGAIGPLSVEWQVKKKEEAIKSMIWAMNNFLTVLAVAI
ncbi:hypothetical protein QUB11_29045 [Microcoleus sp. B6-A1]|uniref:hypothetical protein n=1 Tax=Microcoleus sp. B6-A1 TaxID=2818684 RepID=UPI002FD1EC57